MRKMLSGVCLVFVLAGCKGLPAPGAKETYLKAVDVAKIEDASGGYLCGRFIDSTFTPLGFMSPPRFYLSVKNLDTGEISWMPFAKDRTLLYYQLAPGRYVVSQAVKEVPIYYENGSERTQRIHKAPYALPEALLSEFQIQAGEVLYLGTLTPKDQANKATIVYDNDYAKTYKALTRAAFVMEDFTIKPFLEPDATDTEGSEG